MCDCEFDPNPNDPDEIPWHYLRMCLSCGFKWYSVHCPHDGYQNPCPDCGRRPEPVKESSDGK